MPLAPVGAAPAPSAALPKPPVRLRAVLFVTLIVGLALWLHPRAVAGWQVHELSGALADYGACMVGPTGPSLLRSSNLDEFGRLVRRRLLSAAPGEAPFARCSGLARKLSDSSAVEQAHRASAAQFDEYGAGPLEPRQTLRELEVSPERVVAHARNAWPFVRKGYTSLVQTTLNAKEAIHPVAPARPAVGRGLPGPRAIYRGTLQQKDGLWLAYGRGARFGAYKSADGGATWKAWPSTGVEAIRERCPIDSEGRGYALGTSADGSTTTVASLVPGREPFTTPLVSATHAIIATACDTQGLVVLSKSPREKAHELWLCEFERRCAPVSPPVMSGLASPLEYPADVARVAGTTVVALTMGGVVRVASSRDNGKSWAPFAVAYDDGEYPDLRVVARVPNRLLAVGRRLFLYAAPSKSAHTYSLLISDDQGASFRGL